jgi:16S rRNA pseudouridine516 synthase
VISPRSHVPKVYRATLDRPLSGGEGAIFAAGDLMLEGETEPLAAAELEPTGPTEALLTITEGRYHQVRRMFAAVGNHVTALHRERIGGLSLPADLAPGDWRILTPEEQTALFNR